MRCAGHVDKEVEALRVPVAEHAPDLVGEVGKGARVAGVELQRDRTCAGVPDFRHDLVGGIAVAVVGQDR